MGLEHDLLVSQVFFLVNCDLCCAIEEHTHAQPMAHGEPDRPADLHRILTPDYDWSNLHLYDWISMYYMEVIHVARC